MSGGHQSYFLFASDTFLLKVRYSRLVDDPLFDRGYDSNTLQVLRDIQKILILIEINNKLYKMDYVMVSL